MTETTKLRLTNRTTFTDRDRDVEYTGPGIFDVPTEAAEEYLEARPEYWEEVSTQSSGTDDSTDDSETSSDSDDSETSEDFDAAAFVDGQYQSVVNAIQDGQADGHLDAVQEAEESRDNGARDSVLSAIEARRGEV